MCVCERWCYSSCHVNNNSAEIPHYQPYQTNRRAAFTFVHLRSPSFHSFISQSSFSRHSNSISHVSYTTSANFNRSHVELAIFLRDPIINSFPAISHVTWHAREPTFKSRIPHASDRRFTWIHDGAYRPPVGSNNRLVAGAEKNRRG